jgi:hypothetical protein
MTIILPPDITDEYLWLTDSIRNGRTTIIEWKQEHIHTPYEFVQGERQPVRFAIISLELKYYGEFDGSIMASVSPDELDVTYSSIKIPRIVNLEKANVEIYQGYRRKVKSKP